MNKPLTKLLFVDDDPDLLHVAKLCLKDLSHVEIKFLTCGEEAIKETLSFHPDLIILDVMMPKMDGISTLKTIQLLPTSAEIPVVFITARSQREEIQEYFKLGIVDVIVKPFDPLTLSNKILEIWDNCQKNKKK